MELRCVCTRFSEMIMLFVLISLWSIETSSCKQHNASISSEQRVSQAVSPVISLFKIASLSVSVVVLLAIPSNCSQSCMAVVECTPQISMEHMGGNVA